VVRYSQALGQRAILLSAIVRPLLERRLLVEGLLKFTQLNHWPVFEVVFESFRCIVALEADLVQSFNQVVEVDPDAVSLDFVFKELRQGDLFFAHVLPNHSENFIFGDLGHRRTSDKSVFLE